MEVAIWITLNLLQHPWIPGQLSKNKIWKKPLIALIRIILVLLTQKKLKVCWD
jgi:hypothetical protein